MEIYQHFRPEERPFVEKMLEWVEIAGIRSTPRLTDFLDPRQATIVKSLVNRNPELKLHLFGGYKDAERSRAIIAPEFIPVAEEDFKLAALAIEKKSSFHSLEHKDYLGALLNLGVKREKFGDLFIHPEGAQLIVTKEMAAYVQMHLHQVGRSPVSVVEIELKDLEILERTMDQRTIIVSSKRLDAVLSEILPLSRTKVLPLIKGGKVKVNWRITDEPSYELSVGDLLSVRGFGRVQILGEQGNTKKGNLIWEIGMTKERTS